jgi:hypothetical protein
VIAVAITLNLAIALFCFYVAWRLWRLSKTLGAVADALVLWERNTHRTLNPAVVPPAILQGQAGTAQLRLRYGQLQRQLQLLDQGMAVVGLLPMAHRWLQGRPGLRRARSKRP